MGDHTEEELRNMHPQRTTAEFHFMKQKVVITSDFDSGNMARCEQMDSGNHVSETPLINPYASLQFNIWVSSDSMPYYKYTGFR